MTTIGQTNLIDKIQNTNSNWVCPECKNNSTQYSFQIIATGRNDNYPRWVPQIKESCASCGRYRRFAPQSPVLIKRLNDRLQSIVLPATGRDFYEN
jgi:hypothetical protein